MDLIFVPLRLHVFERFRGIANVPADGFTIAIICQKIYRGIQEERVSSWIFLSFFPSKVWLGVYPHRGRPLETHARVCSSRDTVTTYKGLVRAKRITYAFWIRDRPLPRPPPPTWRFAFASSRKRIVRVRTFCTACQIIVSKSSITFPRNLYYRAPNSNNEKLALGKTTRSIVLEDFIFHGKESVTSFFFISNNLLMDDILSTI